MRTTFLLSKPIRGTFAFSEGETPGAPRFSPFFCPLVEAYFSFKVRTTPRHAAAFSSVSASSDSGTLSYKSVAPARTSAAPLKRRMVRKVKPVLTWPSNASRPTAAPYQHLWLLSIDSMNRIAHVFGAPETVTAQVWHRKASMPSNSGRRYPSTWSTVWISLLYNSIWRLPMTSTLPCSQIRDLSLRSTSVHIVISDSSLGSVRILRMFSASSRASFPLRMVPLIGQVSHLIPFWFFSTRTNISGEAPTNHSPWPKLIVKPYGDGFLSFSNANISLGGAAAGSRKV
mmetsp:Transcript_11356/g.26197  ORF Transcript_11356/g.26197 Transcript_11356/m.26197 type:complete len:286 (-) Transcript_11356:950-1807(-)